MRYSVLIGLIGGIVIAFLQYISALIIPEGTAGLLLYYSPQIVFFMCIYMSVKIYTQQQKERVPGFKECLKAGAITSILIVLLWSIGVFVTLTHTDVNANMQHLISTGRGAYVREFLSQWTKQRMFDQAKMWSLMNFLLGFAMTVLVTVIFRLRGKRTT